MKDTSVVQLLLFRFLTDECDTDVTGNLSSAVIKINMVIMFIKVIKVNMVILITDRKAMPSESFPRGSPVFRMAIRVEGDHL